MKNTEKITLPSNKSFGLVFFIVFLIISLYPLINGQSIRLWSLIISLIFLVLGLLKIISPIVMGIIFFLVVTPTGLIMRILGKDLLNLKYNKNKSYWIEKTGPKSKMNNQF